MSSITIKNKHTYDGPGEYVGRRHHSVLGNKYTHLKYIAREYEYLVLVTTRDEAVRRYHLWLRDVYAYGQGPAYKALMALVDKYINGNDLVLLCWCTPLACHAEIIRDAIVGIANDLAVKHEAHATQVQEHGDPKDIDDAVEREQDMLFSDRFDEYDDYVNSSAQCDEEV